MTPEKELQFFKDLSIDLEKRVAIAIVALDEIEDISFCGKEIATKALSDILGEET